MLNRQARFTIDGFVCADVNIDHEVGSPPNFISCVDIVQTECRVELVRGHEVV